MPLSKMPAYNLRAVLKETGIAADTLRAWERRYGLPKPQRTSGGHRLYSQHDIQLIKWLMARQAEGLSISRAVGQWNELSAAGTDPLADSMPVAVPAAVVSGAAANLDALRDEWLSACLGYDELAGEQVLNQAFALFSPEMVIMDLIQGGLREVGRMWQEGRVTVQQEHFVSALAARRLDALIAATPAPAHAQTVLLACPPDEWHALPLLLLSLLLRRRGWNVVYLGANVPMARLEETVDTVRPNLVALAAQQLATAAHLRDATVRIVSRHVPVAFGGRIFNQIPELRDQISGSFLGEDLHQACGRIGELLEQAPTVEPGRPETRGRTPAAEAYRGQRKLIESALEQRFGAADGPLAANLSVANFHFGNALEAALELGNIAYVGADLEWIEGLLGSRDLSEGSLRQYLIAYAATLRQVIGPPVADVSGWLEGYASRS